MEYKFSITSEEEVNEFANRTSFRDSNPLVACYETWSTRYKCFQVYICYQMGFLSSLKFCQSAGTFGYAIIVPYIVFCILVGLPAVLVEIILGRFVMGQVSRSWNMCPPARSVFFLLIMISSYTMIQGFLFNTYLLRYFFASLTGNLEWKNCSDSHDDFNCYVLGEKSHAFSKCLKTHSEKFCRSLTWETSGVHYFRKTIGNVKSATEGFITTVCLIISIALILVITFKGIRGMEKILSVLMYSSIGIWTVLVFVSYCSYDALLGFKKFWDFDCTIFLDPKIWITGFEDVVFFLNLGCLSLSFISSHGKFTDNILYDVLVVTFSGFLCCVLYPTPILSVIRNTKYMDDVANNDPLFTDMVNVIISMSEAFLFYPQPSWLWCALFFLNSFLVTWGSQAVLTMALVECLEEISGKKGKYAIFIIILAILVFLICLAFLFLQWVREINYLTSTEVTLILCTISWQAFYGIRKFNYDYYFMTGHPVSIFFKFTWFTLLTVPIIAICLKTYYKIPNKPIDYIVYIYIAVPIFFFLLFIFINVRNIKTYFQANPEWGPANTLLKKSRLVFESSTVTTEFMYRQELYKKPFMKPPDFANQNIVQVI